MTSRTKQPCVDTMEDFELGDPASATNCVDENWSVKMSLRIRGHVRRRVKQVIADVPGQFQNVTDVESRLGMNDHDVGQLPASKLVRQKEFVDGLPDRGLGGEVRALAERNQAVVAADQVFGIDEIAEDADVALECRHLLAVRHGQVLLCTVAVRPDRAGDRRRDECRADCDQDELSSEAG